MSITIKNQKKAIQYKQKVYLQGPTFQKDISMKIQREFFHKLHTISKTDPILWLGYGSDEIKAVITKTMNMEAA